ncbi:MAG TPA: MMPL family transporter [Acidimicrobiales bacterium]|nr:MMPL family transporter [Acidimicrobiales bacterium]
MASTKSSTQRLARACSARPWTTIAIWVAAVVVSGVLSSAQLGDVVTTDANFTNSPEALRARRLIEERLRGGEFLTELYIVSSPTATVDDPTFRAAAGELQTRSTALGPSTVAGVANFFENNDASLVARDRRTMLVPVTLVKSSGVDVSENGPLLREIAADVSSSSGLQVEVFGAASLSEDFSTISEEDLRKGESVGILVALVVLVFVFGALVAGVIPILTALGSIALALATVALFGQLYQFSFFVTNMIAMMGLALGIDYSLFIISRYREERAHGRDELAAIEAAGATASRAVLFSGLTVVVALLGMLLIPTTIFRSLAAGAIFVAVFAVLASLTLLPAILALLGDRINAGRIRRKKSVVSQAHPLWDRVARLVMARPIAAIILGAGVLLLAAIPYLGIETGFAGVTTLPKSAESRQAFDKLIQSFPGGLDSPVEIVIAGPSTDADVVRGVELLQRDLAADGSFGASRVEVNTAGDLTLVSAPLQGDPASDAAVSAISRVRDRYVPAALPESASYEVLVGGQTAFNKDFFDLTDRYMPIVFAFVLSVSFLLLMVVFRSLVVPLKAIIMNLLSVGAAYGLIVLVMQKGVGNEIFGFQQVDVIEAWIPLFLFSVLFGLSMDYHVFLLSRIREHYDQSKDNTESVAHGLSTTGAIITGAALIMVAVFGGFAAGNLVAFQQMGFGLAVAVLIDATIVRSVLVPATMKLLGARNWYLPRWLQWLPQIHIEGTAPVIDVHGPRVAPREQKRQNA